MANSPQSAASKGKDARFAFVLDDELQVGAFVCHVLVANGFVARQFSTSLPFLAELRVTQPELIVLDLTLGQSDAVEVIRHLEVLKYKGKVLLISGRDRATLTEIQQIGISRGLAMLPSLHKPFRASDLRDRLAAVPEVRDALPEAKDTKRARVDLGEALRNRWLELWYQPKINLKSLSVCGAEALLRARHPELGIVSPADLLPPSGDPLYQPLTSFVIQQAMADWEHFADQGKPLKLAVNIPVSVLHVTDFISALRESLPKDPRFPGLIFEVTEDEVIRDPEWTREIATQLRLYDVWMSIDDFGTAYSSLSRLLDVPCVELKLDRSFVSNCSSDQLKRALCQTVVDLAHRFGASVCAEGVENAGDLRTLIDVGCDTAQGFLFARPMSRELFTKMLLTKAVGSKEDSSPTESPLAANRRWPG